jgi:transketolase
MDKVELSNLRVEYGKQLVKVGHIYKNLIAIDADLKESTQSIQFEEAFPDRFFESGIAEQNLIGIAAGLARCNKIPVVHSFASFISMKACEQIRTSVAFQNLNVKMVVSHAGVSAGSAGTTHHAIEDIAILRSMPNMKVLVPGDATDVKNCVQEMMETIGPVYLRISASEVPNTINKSISYHNGNPYKIKEGGNIAILTTGITLNIGEKVTKILLDKENLDAKHLHFSKVKPMNVDAIKNLITNTDVIYTIEEHNIMGGFGSAISEVVATYGGCRVIRLGINDHYCMPASQKYIFEKEGLSPEGVVNNILKTR